MFNLLIISSRFLEGFTILLAILFPKNSPVASAALRITFVLAVFQAFIPACNNCFQYLLDKFLANDKNPHPLTYFLVLGSTE